MPAEMMRLGEVCELLKVHGNTLRRWSDLGLIKSFRIGLRGDRRFPREGVEEFLRRDMVPGARTQVGQMVAQGMSNTEIAKRLHYSVPTIMGHVSALHVLYSVHTRSDLVKALKVRMKVRGN